jgi:pimeloyl-ACP methyl ester carboxylesterase
VVFLNGLSGDHLYWAGQMRAFGKHFRCIGVDNRDAGQTTTPPIGYTIKTLAGDVLGLLDHLGLEAAHVVGLSMGGMIAQELALAAPERVRSLVLAGTLARCDAWFLSTLRAFELIRHQVPDTPSFFEAVLSWWVSWRFLEQGERVTWLRWLLRQNPFPQTLAGFLRQLEATRSHDALERLPQIRCPVLVLVGEDDGIAPVRYSQQLHDKLSGSQLVVLPGIGHAPPLEDPGEFNRRVLAFLVGI